jgi:asparagine synthase (glutamine-hydrolysing)
MCGILGGWAGASWAESPNTVSAGATATDAYGRIPSAAITAALDTIYHRGPDSFGEHRDGPVVIAMRRLAIIDPGKGRQPIYNEDGSVAVVFNGMIYNYQALQKRLAAKGHVFRTDTDTEVLVHLYEEMGPEMCSELEGMFAFAIWDARLRRLFVARDRFGKKPLFYSRTPSGGLIYASELKALRKLADATTTKLEVRPQSIYDFLSLGVVPQPDSVYEGVKTLEPGSWMTFDGHRLNTHRYHRWDFSKDASLTEGQAIEEIRARVREAVRLRLRSDVPLGVFLSGGVDSSIVAWEARQLSTGVVRTFTIATGETQTDESSVAERTAKKIGVEFTKLHLKAAPLEDLQRLVRLYDQPYADSSAIPSMAVSRLAREHVTVVLNGDGGDELFAGYRRHLAVHMAGKIPQVLPAPAAWAAARELASQLQKLGPARRSKTAFASRFLRGYRAPAGLNFLIWNQDMFTDADKRPGWKRGSMRPTEDLIEARLPKGLDPLATFMAGDLEITLLSDLLVKMDMATMGASLEARSPFLDQNLASFMTRVPGDLLLGSLKDPKAIATKALLKKAYRGRIPDEVIDAPKRGFEIPMAKWLDAELKPLLFDTVAAPNARVRDYLDGAVVDDVLNRRVFTERNWAAATYSLLVLELWLREFNP